MTKHFVPETVAQELGRISPLVSYAVSIGDDDGATAFLFKVTHRVTTDEMISICRDMAAVIRREIPEREGGWAALIYAEQWASPTMGWYYVGWAGRADEWKLDQGQERKATDYGDWLVLFQRLRRALSTIGTEGEHAPMTGDFLVMDSECGRHEQTIFIRRPEFLSRELIATIQKVLSDGFEDWIVDIRPSFPPPLDKFNRGIVVTVDRFEERWNKRAARRILGNRLKI